MPVCPSHHVGLPDSLQHSYEFKYGAQVMGSMIRVGCEISWEHHHLR
jgi:hypothetical protein